MSILRNVLGSLFAKRAPREESGLDIARSLAHAQTATRSGNVDEAERIVAAVLASATEPDARASALLLRADARSSKRNFLGALADYDAALAIRPLDIDCRLARGGVLHTLGRFEEALAAADAILAIDPRHAIAHSNRGLMLRELGRLEEAEAALGRALACDPSQLDARANLAMILIEQGRLDAAERELGAVAEASPQHPQMRWNRAMLHLLRGEFAAGWRDYESRLERPEHHRRPYAFPQWQGQRLETGTLLVFAEQGLGDEILFASCFNDALERVAQCVIECEPRLVGLFARSFPCARIVGSKTESQPAWASGDVRVTAQIAAGSLPALFRTAASAFPSHHGYLAADPARAQAWRTRLDALGPGLKVGIGWTGGALKTRRSTRSIPLADWLPILRAREAHFVSLQYVDSRAEIAALGAAHGITVHDWLERGADYDDTAALAASLDLVITVTTSLAHLCGALGRPVWILVPANPEWRYMAAGESMLWYPSARLFRQSRLREWPPVVEAVAAALRSIRAP